MHAIKPAPYSRLIPHLQKHPLHVRDSKPLVSRPTNFVKRPDLPGCYLVLLKAGGGCEESAHVPDEGFGDSGRHIDRLSHGCTGSPAEPVGSVRNVAPSLELVVKVEDRNAVAGCCHQPSRHVVRVVVGIDGHGQHDSTGADVVLASTLHTGHD